jgi:hypothetical protein
MLLQSRVSKHDAKFFTIGYIKVQLKSMACEKFPTTEEQNDAINLQMFITNGMQFL